MKEIYGWIIMLLIIIGWIMCLVKFLNCDFKTPYKAEVIYGIGTFSGLGGIIGYLNIQD